MRTQSVPGLRDVQCLESTFALPLDVSVCAFTIRIEKMNIFDFPGASTSALPLNALHNVCALQVHNTFAKFWRRLEPAAARPHTRALPPPPPGGCAAALAGA